MRITHSLFLVFLLSGCVQTSIPVQEVALLEDVQKHTPDISWSGVYRETYVHGGETLKGYSMSAPVKTLGEYRDSLENMLREEGWFVWQPIVDADGAKGSVWGYPRYEGDNIVQVIIFSWHEDCVSSSGESQLVCSNPSSEVFLSEVGAPLL